MDNYLYCIEKLNLLLNMSDWPARFHIFITGASGSGKTALAQILHRHIDRQQAHLAFFDSIGVPPSDEMIAEYGSMEAWQESAIHRWVARLTKITDKKLILLEGQCNPHFIADACRMHLIRKFLIVNIHSNDSTRESRLIQLRNQPELANADMRNWAAWLNRETKRLGGVVLENEHSLENTLAHLAIIIFDNFFYSVAASEGVGHRLS